MVITEEILSNVIGSSVGMYPNEVENMLVKNKVLRPAPVYTLNQLVKGVFIGLNENPSFSKEYISWVQQIITTLNF